MTLSTRNKKKTTQNHIVIKFLKISNKENSTMHSEKDILHRGIIRTEISHWKQANEATMKQHLSNTKQDRQ